MTDRRQQARDVLRVYIPEMALDWALGALCADPVAVLSLLGEDVRADIDCCAALVQDFYEQCDPGEVEAADRLRALLAETEAER